MRRSSILLRHRRCPLSRSPTRAFARSRAINPLGILYLGVKARKPAPNFCRGQATTGMCRDRCQSRMQSVEADMIAIGELIEDPQYTVHFKSDGSGQLAKPSVAGQKGPLPRLCDSKGKRRIGCGQIRARCRIMVARLSLAGDSSMRRPSAVSRSPRSPASSNKEQVGDRKFKREAKQILEKAGNHLAPDQSGPKCRRRAPAL